MVVTATNHPSALLQSRDLKKNAIVVDVSQPPNLSAKICQERIDVKRIDGGYVEVPQGQNYPLMPPGKIFSCIAEILMQSMENEEKDHVGAIDLIHLQKTLKWSEKYEFQKIRFSSFGKSIHP